MSVVTVVVWVVGLAGLPDDLRTWREEWLPMLDFLSINHLGVLSLTTVALLWADERWDWVNRLREWRARRQVPEGVRGKANLSVTYRATPPASGVGGWVGRMRAVRIIKKSALCKGENRRSPLLLLHDFLDAHRDGANFSGEMISKGMLMWWIDKEVEGEQG
ncbi:MAG: hypothetical protein OXN97_14105 [Bryobacterales bacterium]|nr:hypothetical protein [Bryobacterales bacterium]